MEEFPSTEPTITTTPVVEEDSVTEDAVDVAENDRAEVVEDAAEIAEVDEK